MTRDKLTTALEIAGGCLVALGIGLFSVPAAVIATGIMLVVAGGLLA